MDTAITWCRDHGWTPELLTACHFYPAVGSVVYLTDQGGPTGEHTDIGLHFLLKRVICMHFRLFISGFQPDAGAIRDETSHAVRNSTSISQTEPNSALQWRSLPWCYGENKRLFQRLLDTSILYRLTYMFLSFRSAIPRRILDCRG